MPQESISPGANVSITTAAFSASRVKSLLSCSEFLRSNVMYLLLRPSTRNGMPAPLTWAPYGVTFRIGSPSGGSIFITSAPNSARKLAAMIPEKFAWLASRTRTSSSTSGLPSGFMTSARVFPHEARCSWVFPEVTYRA